MIQRISKLKLNDKYLKLNLFKRYLSSPSKSSKVIAIRREDQSIWERRAPLGISQKYFLFTLPSYFYIITNLSTKSCSKASTRWYKSFSSTKQQKSISNAGKYIHSFRIFIN